MVPYYDGILLLWKCWPWRDKPLVIPWKLEFLWSYNFKPQYFLSLVELFYVKLLIYILYILCLFVFYCVFSAPHCYAICLKKNYKFKRDHWFSDIFGLEFIIGYPSNPMTMLHYWHINNWLSDWKEGRVIGLTSSN